MGVAAVGAAAAVASAGVGIAGALSKSNAVSQGQQQANTASLQGLTTATNQLSPWTTTGVPANTAESNLLGLNGPDAANAAFANYQTSPGYQWQMQQGLRGVDAGAAAKGMLRSGATLKGEDTFAQGLADSDFSNYYNRLAGLSTQGLTAAGGIANAAVGVGNNIAGTDTSAGAAQSSIYGQAASGVGTAVNSLANNTAIQNLLGGQGGVSPSSAYTNQLYQNQAFAAQPAGTFGPFQ